MSINAKKIRPSRRSFMIMASAFAVSSAAIPTASVAGPHNIEPIYWRGAALGAEGIIELHHPDRKKAEAALIRCQKEIDKLEELFSLYRPESAISQLNGEGFINDPDIRFLDLLSQAQSFSEKTNGVFDITVQSLWVFYAHFFNNPATEDVKRPRPADLQQVLRRTGYQHLEISTRRIAFSKPGMAITLNGIAQGYITDRIKNLLKEEGFDNVLLSLGEIATIGPKVDGSAWQVGLEGGMAKEDTTQRIISLQNQAVATSGGYASPFSYRSTANHLLHPKTGHWSSLEGSVSVVAKKAVIADMASTALALMTHEERARFLNSQSVIDAVYFSSSKDGENWKA
ncbi:FAD:protein FMN transferase [Sneathiella sp. P13V-1]|uniref:FAD:protein FMN transferase n=1 Tax=Sneathiella sp. P13V-1 TaxID=2697366 RepID=UPI00187BBDF4|nr:FAD:protein FMN transferase [Sneathiella sp. P13V-1]MBE7635920.1 FAD:protein FMN transferase [Sneathiella sp. P13V-1]